MPLLIYKHWFSNDWALEKNNVIIYAATGVTNGSLFKDAQYLFFIQMHLVKNMDMCDTRMSKLLDEDSCGALEWRFISPSDCKT